MNKYLTILLSLPKTIWTNILYLPIRYSWKLPLFVSYDTRVRIKGKVIIDNPKTADIRIGFHHVDVCNDEKTKLIVEKNGTLVFQGDAHIGHGSRIVVHENAQMILGKNFAISANSSIQTYNQIVFGDDIQFSWDCLVMDSDTHSIIDNRGIVSNSSKPVTFGNKIWIGCRSTILKGSVIPDNCVIGAGSLVCGGSFPKNVIIAGSPAKPLKEIRGWEL